MSALITDQNISLRLVVLVVLMMLVMDHVTVLVQMIAVGGIVPLRQ